MGKRFINRAINTVDKWTDSMVGDLRFQAHVGDWRSLLRGEKVLYHVIDGWSIVR